MSFESDASRFSQSRKDWATTADRMADRCYCDYWDVDRSDCYDLEALVNEVHDREAGYATHQILDYGGCDRIVDCGDRHVHVAQRWRPVSGGDDLSLRIENGVAGRDAELTKWQTAHESRGYVPSVIAFGYWESVLGVFSRFWLLDTRTVLDALRADELATERHPTGDGTAALYVPVKSLRESDAVLNEWRGVGADGGGER